MTRGFGSCGNPAGSWVYHQPETGSRHHVCATCAVANLGNKRIRHSTADDAAWFAAQEVMGS